MKRRRTATLIASLALAAALAAAFSALYWKTIAGWIRPAPAPEKLTIAVIDTYIGSSLVLIASARGHFAAEGLAVTLQPHAAGRTALNAVVENRADLATVGNLPFVFATLNKEPVSIVASIASAFRGAGILARRDRSVSLPADLKGKTIGVTRGTDGHFVLGVILAGYGIAPDAVTLRDISPEGMVAALSSGQVDAIATWEPILTSAKRALGPTGVSFGLDNGYAFWFHIAGRRDFVRNHPATVRKLLRALLRAERDVEEHPAAAAAIVAETTHLERDLFAAVWPDFRLQVWLAQGMLTMLEDQAHWAIANRFAAAAQAPDVLDALDLDGLLAVRPDRVTIIR